MRIFLFLVGGTGSRVMRSLAMQLASGILPIDESGTPIPLEVVPIIIDPHKANEDLKRTENILRWYKQIRKAVHGDTPDVAEGFFAAKISTLSDLLPPGSPLSDTFLFGMGALETRKFRDFISYSTLDTASQALCSTMFSTDQLDTKMDIGFVGSPNIGSVALNQFKDSEEFRQFSNVFRSGDRVFIVSSIFGGTGAAGYPIIVKNIRNAASNPALSNRGDLQNAIIGGLTVLPYFNVQQDEKSPISRADFISKTKSALYYYKDNLTGIRKDGTDSGSAKINIGYYLGDEVPSNPYFNDPGGNGQRNDAHLVEYAGGLHVFDFASTPADMLLNSDGESLNPLFREYCLREDKMSLTLKDFGMRTRLLVNRRMVKFHLAYMYITHQLAGDIGRGYTEDKPEIRRGFLGTAFHHTLTSDFFVAYRQWLSELRGNQRSFEPFVIDTEKVGGCIKGIAPKTGIFKSPFDYRTLLSALNKESQKAAKASRYLQDGVPAKLMGLLDKVLDGVIDEKLNPIV